MKKFLLIFFVCFVTLQGCSKNESTAPTTTLQIEESIIVSQTESEIILRNTEDWMTVGLETIGLEEFNQSQVEEGNLQTSSGCEKYRAIILSNFHDNVVRKSYLAVELKDKVIIRPFVKDIQATYADIIYLRDIDGDKTDDIIMQSTIDMTGEVGSYVSQIYRVTGTGIEQVFLNSSNKPYYTNYTGVISSDCKMTIYNPSFVYKVVFDYPKDQYLNALFSEYSTQTTNELLYLTEDSIYVDSFELFVPVDLCSDGVFEFECSQKISIFRNSNYIGDLKTVLKYNPDTELFDIIYSWFEITDSNKTFSVEDYEWYIENFPANGNIGTIEDEDALIEIAKGLWDEEYGEIQGQTYDPTHGCEVKVFYDESYDYWLVQGTLPSYSTGMVPFLIVSGNGDLIAIGLR